jgi:hypothetical protein
MEDRCDDDEENPEARDFAAALDLLDPQMEGKYVDGQGNQPNADGKEDQDNVFRYSKYGHALDVKTPGGRYITKQAAVYLVLQNMERVKPGSLAPKMSKDRHRRIMQSAEHSARRSLLACHGQGSIHDTKFDLRCGTDVALRLVNKNTKRGSLHFAKVRRMTKLTGNGKRVLLMRPVQLANPPKSLHCSFDFFVEVNTEGENTHKYHFGADGGVQLDIKQFETQQHILGLAFFDYDEKENTHELKVLVDGKTQFDEFQAEVDRLQPTQRRIDITAATRASRVANQHSDIVNVPRGRTAVTRSGRRSGQSYRREFKIIVDRWKKAFAEKMVDLNWEVYSVEHLPEDVYDTITYHGRDVHIQTLIDNNIKMPGVCSCAFCVEEGIKV